MARQDMKDWEDLFARALQVLDGAQRADGSGLVWSLGGGSALMRRHRHRRSAGVDIFLRDERMLHRISPLRMEAPGSVALDWVEESSALRLYFPEGEIAFIAGGLITSDPVRRESILGRSVLVQTSAEILARKVWNRAATLPARDLFDFAAVSALEPSALRDIGSILRARRMALLDRVREHAASLREDFAALEPWEFKAGFDECAAALRATLARSLPPPVLEEARGVYVVQGADLDPGPSSRVRRPGRRRVTPGGEKSSWATWAAR